MQVYNKQLHLSWFFHDLTSKTSFFDVSEASPLPLARWTKTRRKSPEIVHLLRGQWRYTWAEESTNISVMCVLLQTNMCNSGCLCFFNRVPTYDLIGPPQLINAWMYKQWTRCMQHDSSTCLERSTCEQLPPNACEVLTKQTRRSYLQSIRDATSILCKGHGHLMLVRTSLVLVKAVSEVFPLLAHNGANNRVETKWNNHIPKLSDQHALRRIHNTTSGSSSICANTWGSWATV